MQDGNRGGLSVMAPLTGYNSNVRHRGRMFHIQTEDSGQANPRILTHLFADGGRIVKSSRSEYAEHLAEAEWPAIVRELMKNQHKSMFVALRSGELDDAIGFDEDAPPPTEARPSLRLNEPLSLRVEPLPSAKPSPKPSLKASPSLRPRSSPPPEGAQASRSTPVVSAPDLEAPARSYSPPSSGTRTYAAPRPCAIFSNAPTPAAPSLFGNAGGEESSLDSAILDYLADASGK